jgi:hypothetical protein
MIWAQLLAYVYRNDRPRTSVTERVSGGGEPHPESPALAEIAHRLGRKALEEVAGAARPDTILGWYRKLIAKKFDGSGFRQRVGRPRIAEEIERLVVRMAKENPSWGYDRIVGALANLGHRLSDQTVGNLLRRASDHVFAIPSLPFVSIEIHVTALKPLACHRVPFTRKVMRIRRHMRHLCIGRPLFRVP